MKEESIITDILFPAKVLKPSVRNILFLLVFLVASVTLYEVYLLFPLSGTQEITLRALAHELEHVSAGAAGSELRRAASQFGRRSYHDLTRREAAEVIDQLLSRLAAQH